MDIMVTPPIAKQINFELENFNITLDYFIKEVGAYLSEHTDGSIVVDVGRFQNGIIWVIQNAAQRKFSDVDQATERIAKILKKFKADPDPATIL